MESGGTAFAAGFRTSLDAVRHHPDRSENGPCPENYFFSARMPAMNNRPAATQMQESATLNDGQR
jgi:hypothetical protein